MKKYDENEVANLRIEAFESGRLYISHITRRNYAATVRRGLITEDTPDYRFILKIKDEIIELIQSRGHGEYGFDPTELADVALVCFAMAEHFDIDLVEEMKKKTEFNETRP